MALEPAAAARGNATVAVALAAAFRRHGVEVMFGQSIPTSVYLATPQFGIRQVAYRAENAGGVMADGYARATGKVGVVTAQNGPAATLLVAPLAESLKASIPVVALVQDVARGTADRNAFQELDHFALFSGVAKWVRRIDRADRVDAYVDMAFTAAATGRPGPAVLLVSADMFGEAADATTARTTVLGTWPLDRTAPEPSRIDFAADLLANAQHPLIWAGGGVHSSQAAEALAALQEAAHLPVGTTVMGKGTVAETHPLTLGVVGYFMGERSRTHAMRPMLDRADVVLLIGNRTNQNGSDSWKLFPAGKTFIHLDIDGQEVGRNYESIRLVGDAKLGIEALTAALRQRDLSRRTAARPALEAEIAAALAQHRQAAAGVTGSDAAPVRPERLMADIARVLTPESIVVADASYSSIWISNYLTATRPGQRFLTPRGIAGLGWGLPMAIGAKIGQPQAPVICLAGDGGFAHCWAELETARRMGTNIPIVVLNNQVLGYQKDAEDVLFGAHTDAVDFAPVDHAAIARACGCHGERIERAADFLPALQRALAADRPTVIDVLSDPQARPPLTFYDGAFSLTPPAALIVDIDGVVIDTPHERAWREALAARHAGEVLTPAEYATLVAGKPRLAGARAALAAHGITAEAEVEAYAAAKQARFLALVEAGDFVVFGDAVRYLEAARAAGLRIATASSSKNAAAMLARAGIAALFDADLSGRDVPHGKPAPDLFLLAAAELGVLAAQCLVLEDAPAGIAAARAAGMASLGVARHGEVALLQQQGADLVVATLDAPEAHALLAHEGPPHG